MTTMRENIINVLIVTLTFLPFIFVTFLLTRTDNTEPKAPSPGAYVLTFPTSSPLLWGQNSPQAPSLQPAPHADVYVQFVLEAFDKILQVHYKVRTEGEMVESFAKGYAHATGTTTRSLAISPQTRDGFIAFLVQDLEPRAKIEKRRIAVGTVTNVLELLEPTGRNRLMSKTQEVSFRQAVSNIHPEKDLYADVGVPKNAGITEVTKTYEEKKQVLEASTTEEAKVELAKVTYAKDVLTNTVTRERYNTSLIEPTVFSRPVGERYLYVAIRRIAPTTFSEFEMAIADASTSPMRDRLVIDLSGNIGGALDFSLMLFGAYLGPGVPVLGFQHQSTTWKEKTVGNIMPELSRYEKQIVIVDQGTQSTAEVVASVFQHKKLALLIGARTAGWGTIENTFPMQTIIDSNTTYTLFLVHSLTLRDDGTPIQGNGIIPDVDVSQVGWGDAIARYVGDVEAPKTVLQILTSVGD